MENDLPVYVHPAPAEIEAMKHAAQQSAIRQKIAEIAGDNASLLGTTTDALHLLFFEMAKFAVSMASAKTLEDARKAAAPFAALSRPFLDEIAAGSTRFPFTAKPLDVVTDMGMRATRIADAIADTRAAFAEASPESAATSKTADALAPAQP